MQTRKIIILKLALSYCHLQRQDKLLFKINKTFDKDQTTETFFCDGKNISDSIAFL